MVVPDIGITSQKGEHMTQRSDAMDSQADARLSQLRDVLKSRDLDGFYLTRADRFQGEEVREEDEYLAYLTGFTGSAGIGLILDQVAGLFTDGRYRLQIAQQTDASLYQSFDSAEKTLAQWMAEQKATGQVRLGYDSWSVSVGGLEKLPLKLGGAEISWVGCRTNPLNEVWQNRPASDSTDIFILDEDITGQSASQKQAEAAEELHQAGCRFSLITAPDCVNWLANIRGRDLQYTPFHLCFGLLGDDGDLVFIGGGSVLQEAGYQVLAFDEVAGYLAGFKGARLSCDPTSLPVAMHGLLVQAGLEIVLRHEPLLARKACKNEQEISGFRESHLRDGLALCHFWHWLENSTGDTRPSEAELAEKLTSFRAEDAGYICDSFATIAGFRDNGAIVHYRAIKGHDKVLDTDGVLLIDSGAHYQMGTTDITRTLFYGPDTSSPPEAAIRQASYVLAAHIDLARAQFPHGTTGAQLDAICRAPLWAQALDFGHGTGHGVGHILSVHEGPVSISKRCQLPVEAGMVLSNEPGYYVEGSYGIRHENLVLVTEQADSYLAFETLTCFPFDTKLLAADLLTAEQKSWLNAYHSWVFSHLAPHLPQELAAWLKVKCAAI